MDGCSRVCVEAFAREDYQENLQCCCTRRGISRTSGKCLSNEFIKNNIAAKTTQSPEPPDHRSEQLYLGHDDAVEAGPGSKVAS